MDSEYIEAQKNSLSDQLNDQLQIENEEAIEEEIQQIDYHKKIEQIHHMISNLNQEEEILKQSLKAKQSQLLQVFMVLNQKKKYMRDLVLKEINKKQIILDVGLQQEFELLKIIIKKQQNQIEQLKMQITNQGLSSKNNDHQFIKMIIKIQQMQKQIEVGRKFSSTQFVRDYLEKPQAYKVAYQQVKYEFEIRTKIKESLQQQKQLFKKKQQEVSKSIIKEKQIEQQLLQTKDLLLKQLSKLS